MVKIVYDLLVLLLSLILIFRTFVDYDPRMRHGLELMYYICRVPNIYVRILQCNPYSTLQYIWIVFNVVAAGGGGGGLVVPL